MERRGVRPEILAAEQVRQLGGMANSTAQEISSEQDDRIPAEESAATLQEAPLMHMHAPR